MPLHTTDLGTCVPRRMSSTDHFERTKKKKLTEVVAKKAEEEENGDFKSWMHQNGLPPCKIFFLKERTSHYRSKHRPISYVAASEDLQTGDIAFSVPWESFGERDCGCGPQPNSKLLIYYGFVDEDNAYDRLLVEAALNSDDPQYQDKRLVAQRDGNLSLQAFHVYAGKEREAVLDMLPYLRRAYISDASGMPSVFSSQGTICPVNPCMERAVLDQLVDFFERRLAGYPTALIEDEALVNLSSGSGYYWMSASYCFQNHRYSIANTAGHHGWVWCW
ncbi:hypothetical protein ACH5RR_010975 [Cinchona calisaya]|uniref:Rubisco LSMT substrate-binding domain-containing protein n=1 Tax=Cinchona calisaya TaxID=153742 RepID=A0ABD3A3K9_9GENT